MERYKLEQHLRREEYNYNGYAAFVMIVINLAFAGIVLGGFKLISWLVQIGG